VKRYWEISNMTQAPSRCVPDLNPGHHNNCTTSLTFRPSRCKQKKKTRNAAAIMGWWPKPENRWFVVMSWLLHAWNAYSRGWCGGSLETQTRCAHGHYQIDYFLNCWSPSSPSTTDHYLMCQIPCKWCKHLNPVSVLVCIVNPLKESGNYTYHVL
jgi:hypothetical protein